MLMAADVLSAYPDYNKRFDIYTDPSDFQVGACSMQDSHIVAYFSRKLNKSQRTCTTIEKEILSIVATLNEFCSTLLGANVYVWTDHKNLTFDTIKTQRVLRWRNQVEEYSPILHYIEGPRNILADNLSRLNRLNTPDQIAKGESLIEPAIVSDNEDEDIIAQVQPGICDQDINDTLGCYINLPERNNPEQNPLNCTYIHEQQQADPNFWQHNKRFSTTVFINTLMMMWKKSSAM